MALIAASAPNFVGLRQLNGLPFAASAASSWTGIGSSSSNPASSATAILNANPSAPSGAYWLNHGSGAYQAYCWMSSGGWFLVAKIARAQNSAWHYNGPNWGTGSPVNEAGIARLNDEDAVGRGYYEYSARWLAFSLGADPFQCLLTEPFIDRSPRTQITSTGGCQATRAEFVNWVTTGVMDGGFRSNWYANQPNCNQKGFTHSVNRAAGRYGVTGNNEADCNTCDSWIGLGAFHNDANNFAAGGSATHTSALYRHGRCFIWAR